MDNMIIPKEYLNIYTTKNQSETIINILNKYLNNSSVIIDANSGIGGNTLSFIINYKYVYAIDILDNSIDILEKNIRNSCNNNNFFLINDSCINYLKIIIADTIFFDPPWGGKNYKKNNNLDLYLDNISLINIIDNLYFYYKFIFVKAPKNYNNFISKIWKFTYYNIQNKYLLFVYYK